MTDIDMKIVPVVHPARPTSHTVAPESSALSDLFDNYSHPIALWQYRYSKQLINAHILALCTA